MGQTALKKTGDVTGSVKLKNISEEANVTIYWWQGSREQQSEIDSCWSWQCRATVWRPCIRVRSNRFKKLSPESAPAYASKEIHRTN